MKRLNRSHHILIVLTLAALMAASTTAAFAERGGRGKGAGRFGVGEPGGRGQGPNIERLAARLDLSDDQVAAIREIHEQGRLQSAELRKELMRLRNEVQGEMMQDDPSQKKVLALNAKMGELRTELRAQRLKNQLAVREELTPEQRDRMLLMREQGNHRRGGRHSGRGHGPQGGNGSGGGHGWNQDCPNVVD